MAGRPVRRHVRPYETLATPPLACRHRPVTPPSLPVLSVHLRTAVRRVRPIRPTRGTAVRAFWELPRGFGRPCHMSESLLGWLASRAGREARGDPDGHSPAAIPGVTLSAAGRPIRPNGLHHSWGHPGTGRPRPRPGDTLSCAVRRPLGGDPVCGRRQISPATPSVPLRTASTSLHVSSDPASAPEDGWRVYNRPNHRG